MGISTDSIANTLIQHFPSQYVASQWNAPTFWDVLAAVQKCHGAAGCDSWTSEEARFLPEESLRIFHDLAMRWYEVEQIPVALTKGRMVNILNMLTQPFKRQISGSACGAAYGHHPGAVAKAAEVGLSNFWSLYVGCVNMLV